MSYIFDIDDITVWSPALRIGELYVGFVHVVESQMDETSGFKDIASDMIDIDANSFIGFVNVLITLSATPHQNRLLSWHLRSILGPSIVMLQRAGYGARLVQDDSLFEDARMLAAYMPQ